MNHDSRVDTLSSRAYLDENGEVIAEMVWFEQPSVDPLNSTWIEHAMFFGPDADFNLDQLRVAGQTYDVIISTQYFAEKLVISWIEPEGTWTDPSNIQHRVLDAVVDERYFHSQLVDLNADGKRDLLVSVNSYDNGKLVAYEIPDDFRFGKWTRHDLAHGFKPKGKSKNSGSPGACRAFYPMEPGSLVFDGRMKPLIMLSGDDDGNVYLFENNADADPAVWSYTFKSFFSSNGTVGSPAINDIDGDGYMDVFVPASTDGQIHTYTFKPSVVDRTFSDVVVAKGDNFQGGKF
ncbi:uncharacterized protein [Amphiura filiformis]|uniref:uncharacterized protein n=1 Tax=Amphiura filiformis TaxID=82378 RepID=UPI003B2145A6